MLNYMQYPHKSVRFTLNHYCNDGLVRMEQNIFPIDLFVELIEAEICFHLGPEIGLPLKSPDIFGRCQAHRQSPLLDCIGSVLCMVIENRTS